MENKRSVDVLSGWILKLLVAAIVLVICWYFRTELIYILVAFVISLLGHPIMRLLRKIKIGKKPLPDTLLAIITIVAIIAIVVLIITRLIPVVVNILQDASLMETGENSLITKLNNWLISLFPSLGPDFDLIAVLLDKVRSAFSFSGVTSVLGSVASIAVDVVVWLFAIIFISFFFIKNENLFSKIIMALVPDSIESSVEKTVGEVTHLLSRYFIGLVIEILGVVLLDFLGLWLIVRINPSYAIGIAFIAGILNIIPYVGPIIGEVIGVLLCLVLKCGAGVGLGVPVWAFILIVLGVMLAVQLIDNFVYQPIIYSTSIKSTPLEIFIVLLLAGELGGTLGLLVGIPAYTVVRVVAARFFYQHKIVRRLIPDIEKENTDSII